jgi:hypothetical protein
VEQQITTNNETWGPFQTPKTRESEPAEKVEQRITTKNNQLQSYIGVSPPEGKGGTTNNNEQRNKASIQNTKTRESEPAENVEQRITTKNN